MRSILIGITNLGLLLGSGFNILLADTEGLIEHHQVFGESLLNNLTGEADTRTVAVYLPPGYSAQVEKRYPVLYLLHGIVDTETSWTQSIGRPDDAWATVDRIMNQAIKAGRFKEMVVVMPDMTTNAGGSFYVNSSVTGRWEDFVVDELVPWVDAQFRTISRAESRGLAGHSMGGYGTLSISMKHPDVFSVAYALSPGVVGWGADISASNPSFRTILDAESWDDIEPGYEQAIVALGQAFSPNPQNPPFYFDAPFRENEDGDMVPSNPGHSAWTSHLILPQLEEYAANLRALKALRFDTGSYDQYPHIIITPRELSVQLRGMNIDHVFEEYNGDHRNRLWGKTGRMHTEVLPWFSLLLEAQ